jgi:hypothetical protein
MAQTRIYFIYGLYFYFTELDFFTEYFGLCVVPFLRLGLGSGLGLGFTCANKKQIYEGHITFTVKSKMIDHI